MTHAGIHLEHTAHDDLLECLVVMSQLNHHPFSASALKAGLPLQDQKLTFDSFTRAAQRAGFSTKVVHKSLAQVSNVLLPAILLLENNQAVVLEKVDAASGKALIHNLSAGRKKISLSALESAYSGYLILLKAEYQLEDAVDVRNKPKAYEQNWFWSTLWRSRKIYRDVFIASILINVFALVGPLFTMNVYDRVVPNNAQSTLWVLAIGVSVVYLFDFVFKSLRSHFLEKAGKRTDLLLSSQVFERVMSLKMEASPKSAGSFATMIREFDSVRNFVTSTTMTTFIDFPFVFLYLFAIYMIGGPIFIVALVVIPLILAFGYFTQLKMGRLIEETNAASARRNGLVIEMLTSLETIKTLNSEGTIQSRLEEDMHFLAGKNEQIKNAGNKVGYVAGFLQQMTTVATVIWGVYLIQDQVLSMGALIASVILVGRTLSPMSQAARLLSQYQQTKKGLEILNNIMQMPVEREDGKAFVSRANFDGYYKFENVSFKYCQDCESVLDNVSFEIRPGEKVGIIGKMGSGKSTIQKLLMGLFTPTSGSVAIDGIEMSQIDPVDLRRVVGYVPQEVTLFKGTLRQNIAMRAPHVEDAEIIRAAELGGVTQFSNKHPKGFEMEIEERGASLSGGQRQSIVVARSMLNQPKILIMDEPTNSMDNTSEGQFIGRLQEFIQGRTFVLITHKAGLLKLVDRLIVVDSGKIVADGPRDYVLTSLKQGSVKSS